MPDWMDFSAVADNDPSLVVLATRLGLAWICGWLVAVLARRNQPLDHVDTLTLTLVLMSILIAMATQIIGDNIARAFSLVGALSIVRFRTAVPATRDVAYVLAAVVVGMAVGAGQYWVAGLGIAVVALATHFNSADNNVHAVPSATDSMNTNWRLTLQVGLSATEAWQAELQRFADHFQLSSAETTRRGGAIVMVYRVTPKANASAVELIASLNIVPAVESVAIKVE